MKKLYVLLFISLIIIGKVKGQSDSDQLKVFTTKEELCAAVQFTEPLQQEIDYNKDINKEGYIVYLRDTFNDMLINPEIYKDELILFPDTSYLQSKFIVLTTDYAPGGGYSVVLFLKINQIRFFMRGSMSFILPKTITFVRLKNMTLMKTIHPV